MKQEKPPSDIKFAVLAADTTLFTIRDGELLVRLIRIQRPPHFPDNAGLPGLLRPDETAEEAARRHVEGKARISSAKAHFEQLATFSKIDRDPRSRVVAVAYLGLVPWEKLSEEERQDGTDAYWLAARKARGLAYDHNEIVQTACKRLRSRVAYTTLMQKLMPKEFTLTELEQAYESVLDAKLDKRNFRKKILKLGVLRELPHKRAGGRFRPARLYRFEAPQVSELEIL